MSKLHHYSRKTFEKLPWIFHLSHGIRMKRLTFCTLSILVCWLTWNLPRGGKDPRSLPPHGPDWGCPFSAPKPEMSAESASRSEIVFLTFSSEFSCEFGCQHFGENWSESVQGGEGEGNERCRWERDCDRWWRSGRDDGVWDCRKNLERPKLRPGRFRKNLPSFWKNLNRLCPSRRRFQG